MLTLLSLEVYRRHPKWDSADSTTSTAGQAVWYRSPLMSFRSHRNPQAARAEVHSRIGGHVERSYRSLAFRGSSGSSDGPNAQAVQCSCSANLLSASFEVAQYGGKQIWVGIV